MLSRLIVWLVTGHRKKQSIWANSFSVSNVSVLYRGPISMLTEFMSCCWIGIIDIMFETRRLNFCGTKVVWTLGKLIFVSIRIFCPVRQQSRAIITAKSQGLFESDIGITFFSTLNEITEFDLHILDTLKTMNVNYG